MRHVHLGVIPGLQGFHIVGLAGLLGACDEVIQACIDHRQVSVELALTWHDVLCNGDVPVGNVECGAVLCLLQHAIHSLAAIPTTYSKPIYP